MSKQPGDEDLLNRCRAGDESAWDALTARYADVVYGVARRSGLSGADAGDVVQEVFLALFKSLGRLRKGERLLAWILTTSKREAWRQVKRARKTAARDRARAEADLAQGPLPEEVMGQLEDEQIVRAAFQELTERCRRLLDVLFFQAETHSYEAISRDLGLPVGSIGPTRRRCLEALKRSLDECGFCPPDVSARPVRPSRGQKGGDRGGRSA